MGTVADIALYRARRRAAADVPIGAPPFVLEEPCPGCGAPRISTMVWRRARSTGEPAPFPRIAPHFLCHGGRVVWQDITDAPLPVSAWSLIMGHFEREVRGEG